MFLNLPRHPCLVQFVGLDSTHINSRPDEKVWDQDRTILWEHWANHFMVLTESPYQYLQLMIHVKFIAYGERKDPLNPFQWSHAKLNMPGD